MPSLQTTLATLAITGLTTAVQAQCVPVHILQQPESQTVALSATALFSLSAAGTEEISYQWQQQDLLNLPDFVNIFDGGVFDPFGNVFCTASGANTNSLELANLTGVAQVFRCVATNACGSTESTEVTLTFIEPCPADFNHDSVVDFFDYLDFVQAFADNMIEADFNLDGVIDFFDYLDFVQAFSTTCPS